MELKIFSSLEKKIVTLPLSVGEQVFLYLCGPTVYDHLHVGNLRAIITFDLLVSLLNCLEIPTFFVSNITDVDDKIIQRAKKKKISEKKLANYYIKHYFSVLSKFLVRLPDYSPRVTDFLENIKSFVSQLLEKGHAYKTEKEVLFSLKEKSDYGLLSGQKMDKLKKKNSFTKKTISQNDFVLWKKTEEGIKWESAWGKGRPGWHTECVVFVNDIFKQNTITIHGGGIDLLFPHHENERIQFLAINKKEMSKVWLHVAFVNFDEKKMSKSLENVVYAKDFYQEYGADALRYIFFSSHYRQTINLNKNIIQQSLNYLKKTMNIAKKIKFFLFLEKKDISSFSVSSVFFQSVVNCLLNDLDTTKVFFFWEQVINFLNKNIEQKEKKDDLFTAIGNFFWIANFLGFKNIFLLNDYDFFSKILINKWIEHRKEGRFLLADKCRRKLQKKNILP